MDKLPSEIEDLPEQPTVSEEERTSAPLRHHANRKLWAIIIGVVALLIVSSAVGFILIRKDSTSRITGDGFTSELPQTHKGNDPVKAGKQLSGNKCEGEGPVKLTSSPMKSEDFSMIIPYGLMVGGHVTPIDHQYFSPMDPQSRHDAYEVRALADGRITQISHRGSTVGDAGKSSNDYRFVFAHTCTFLTYFDLVTGLAPDIKAEFDKNAKKSGTSSHANLDIEVKAGQLVGYIGGQTLDFAVWDTQKPLKGFITPDLYAGEAWKLYTADPLDYYSPEVKELILSKYLRTDEGKSGKIDWDIDGKLIGNWFEKDTNGYEGDRQNPDGKYWRGHLAIAPDHLDPSYYIASFGTFAQAGDGLQFVIKSATPKPDEVDASSGLIRYELTQWSYSVNGRPWDRRTAVQNPKITTNAQFEGCALYQLVSARELKAEPFPDQTCASVGGFTANAKTYIR